MRRDLLSSSCVLLVLFAVNCLCNPGIDPSQEARSLPAITRGVGSGSLETVTRPLETPLPAGRAEAFFALDTGADQLGGPARPARLILVLRYEKTEQRFLIAPCKQASLGSALGGGSATHLEVAVCDGEYWLETDEGTVSVKRIEKSEHVLVIRRQLPSGVVRAMTPMNQP